MADKYTFHRYGHGGGRIFVERDSGARDLIVDLYGDGERRDKIVDAMIAMKILPEWPEMNVIDV